MVDFPEIGDRNNSVSLRFPSMEIPICTDKVIVCLDIRLSSRFHWGSKSFLAKYLFLCFPIPLTTDDTYYMPEVWTSCMAW